MARVERILVVVLEADESHSTYRRYAVLDNGTRVADAKWRAGSTSGVFFGSAPDLAERRAQKEASIREMQKRFGARGLPSLVAALAEVGVATTPDELLALPVDVAFGEPEDLPIGEPPQPVDWQRIEAEVAEHHRKIERWAGPAGFALWVVIGAIWPSIWRRPRRGRSLRRQILTGLASFAVTFAVKEWARRNRRPTG